MRKSLNAIIVGAWCIALPWTLFSQNLNTAEQARAVADQALVKARAGETAEALRLYETALRSSPEDVAILRDYAVVLGWAGQYPRAIATIKQLRGKQKDQPVWALREFSRSFLFGDATTDALRVFDELVLLGDDSEQTLIRRAMALRWLGRNAEAQKQYQAILEHYPNSAPAYAGLANSLADDNKLSEALRIIDSAPQAAEQNAEVLQSRIRILNFMGRHLEAQQLISSLPPEMVETRGVLEERVAAERWGGNPVSAQMDAVKLWTLFPASGTRNLLTGIRSEYGHSVSPGFRYSKDSDGLIDRTASSDIAIHLNPAHLIHIGYQYRWLEQHQDVRTLLRYDLGWTGTLNPRLTVYATTSAVDYRVPGVSRKFVGDASAVFTVNDAIRFSGGGGSIVMDAFNAIGNQVTASFGSGDFSIRLDPSTRLRMRYSHYSFSNNVIRDRGDAEIMRSLPAKSWGRFSVGWRSNLMWHDYQTNDFYSPSRFQSHLAVAQVDGRITSWLSYSSEIAAGWQLESDSPSLHPFQAAGKLAWQPGRHLRAIVEGGKSTSSLDRPGNGLRTYSRWVASAGLEIRWP
jgi:Flp pilus assembly protein TadD